MGGNVQPQRRSTGPRKPRPGQISERYSSIRSYSSRNLHTWSALPAGNFSDAVETTCSAALGRKCSVSDEQCTAALGETCSAAIGESCEDPCDCTPGSNYDMPLVIVRPRSRNFRTNDDKDDDNEDDDDDRPVEWEHFVADRAAASRQAARRRKKALSGHDESHLHMSMTDHEATFDKSTGASTVGTDTTDNHHHKKHGKHHHHHHHDHKTPVPQAKSQSQKKQRPTREAKKKVDTVKSASFNRVVRLVRQGEIHEVISAVKTMPYLIREMDDYDQTLLFWAAASEDTMVVRFLLGLKAVANNRNLRGYTPLMRALCHGQLEVAQMLVDAEADVTAQDMFGGTALSIAAGAGQVEAIEWILARHGTEDLLLLRDADGCSPLLNAARCAHKLAARALIKRNANVNHADNAGRPPLLYSLAQNDAETSAALIENDADVNAEDALGKSLVILLVENALRDAELRTRSLCGLLTVLEAKASPDAMDDDGNTSLMMAVKARDVMVVTLLHSFKADLDIADNHSVTPLMFARSKGFNEILIVLRELGVQKIVRKSAISRIFLRAQYYGNVSACRKLLDRSADPSVTTKKGNFMKDWVEKRGHPQILEILQSEQKHQDEIDDDDGEALEALQRCTEHLGTMSKRATRLQDFVLDLNLDAVAQFVVEVTKARCPQEPCDASSVKAMNEFTLLWHRLQVSKARDEIAHMRALRRQQKMEELAHHVVVWGAETNKEDAPELRKIITAGTMGVNSCSVSGNLSQDAEPDWSEAAQRKAIKLVLMWLDALAELCALEFTAIRALPPTVESMLEKDVSPLQCQHCRAYFSNPKTLDKHQRNCESTAGLLRRADFENKREVAAEVYTVRMASAGVGFLKFMGRGRDMMEGYLTECAQLAQKNRDVGLVARGCRVLINGATKVCQTRQAECWQVARSMLGEYPRFKTFLDAMEREADSTRVWIEPAQNQNGQEEEEEDNDTYSESGEEPEDGEPLASSDVSD